MKTIAIKLEYKDKTYLSDYMEADKEKEEEIEKLLELVAKGDLSYMILECYNIKQYFNKQILEQSILGLVYNY